MANVLLIVYDNGSHIPFFPQNVFALSGALKAEKHTVGIWHQDLHHGPASALTKIIDDNPFDIVGLGFVAGYYQYQTAKEIAHAINRSKRRKDINFVLGGHGPGACPDFFLEKLEADTVVVGDGEQAICEIAASNRSGHIQGDPCNSDSYSLTDYHDFNIHLYRLIRWPTSKPTDFCFPILSSRGCKWSCSFCYRMRDGFYQRPVEAIIEEIKFLHGNYDINHFQFSDELLMASRGRTEQICKAIIELPFKIKWDCNGRLNFAKSGILKSMKKAGCEYINYGIESLNQNLLNEMKKGLNIDQIHHGVKATLDAKISPGLNLIWGFPGDTPQNLIKAVDFLKKYDPCHELRTIRPVTPYPGTALYQKAIDDGLLEGPKDFYERKHVNSDLFTVNFMDISTEDAHHHLCKANIELIDHYYELNRGTAGYQAENLYYLNDTSFRGFREV